MEVIPGAGDIYTKQAFGDIQLHLEWMTPIKIDHPLDPGNSGIKLMGLYEVQISDSWTKAIYPDGLAGENIPLLARIIALADSYDAMISDRPYRRRLSLKRVREEIERNAGIQFDPHIVLLFTRHIQMSKDFPPLHHFPNRKAGIPSGAPPASSSSSHGCC